MVMGVLLFKKSPSSARWQYLQVYKFHSLIMHGKTSPCDSYFLNMVLRMHLKI